MQELGGGKAPGSRPSCLTQSISGLWLKRLQGLIESAKIELFLFVVLLLPLFLASFFFFFVSGHRRNKIKQPYSPHSFACVCVCVFFLWQKTLVAINMLKDFSFFPSLPTSRTDERSVLMTRHLIFVFHQVGQTAKKLIKRSQQIAASRLCRQKNIQGMRR